MADACQRCSAELPENASFCAACGARVDASSFSRGQLLILGALIIEVAALAAMAFFVVPSMRAAIFATTGKHSAFTRLVFSPMWVPPFFVPVLILGGLALPSSRRPVSRVLLISACLLIGLIPIFGAAIGIYVATFETAMGDVP